MISPIAKAMAAFLPKPSTPRRSTTTTWAAFPVDLTTGFMTGARTTISSSRQRISTVGVNGARIYLTNFSNQMPLPYVMGTYAKIYPQAYIVEHVFTITPNLVNQLKYSFTRFIQPQINATDGVAAYTPSAFGITNTPQGQGSREFPGATFGTTAAFGTAYTAWTSNGSATTTQQVNPNTYALLDNVQWRQRQALVIPLACLICGKRSTAQPPSASPLSCISITTRFRRLISRPIPTPSAPVRHIALWLFVCQLHAGRRRRLGIRPTLTAPSFGLYPLSETGGRYHPIAPYFRDSYKITPKLTHRTTACVGTTCRPSTRSRIAGPSSIRT